MLLLSRYVRSAAIVLNKIALYFGLQYKPSLGAEYKKYVERKPLQIKI